jgi:hypothetical protein
MIRYWPHTLQHAVDKRSLYFEDPFFACSSHALVGNLPGQTFMHLTNSSNVTLHKTQDTQKGSRNDQNTAQHTFLDQPLNPVALSLASMHINRPLFHLSKPIKKEEICSHGDGPER